MLSLTVRQVFVAGFVATMLFSCGYHGAAKVAAQIERVK